MAGSGRRPQQQQVRRPDRRAYKDKEEKKKRKEQYGNDRMTGQTGTGMGAEFAAAPGSQRPNRLRRGSEFAAAPGAASQNLPMRGAEFAAAPTEGAAGLNRSSSAPKRQKNSEAGTAKRDSSRVRGGPRQEMTGRRQLAVMPGSVCAPAGSVPLKTRESTYQPGGQHLPEGRECFPHDRADSARVKHPSEGR